MEDNLVSSRSRTVLLLIAIIFMIINTIIILLFFNTEFFFTKDIIWWKTRPFLVGIGISFVVFFLILKLLKYLTITRLFIIFIVIQIALFSYFTILEYQVEIDLQNMIDDVVRHVFEGDIFTPYNEGIGGVATDKWRMYPPLWIWWYSYNYWIYGLDPIIWRFVNVLLHIGIAYVMIRIFQEIRANRKGFKEEYFRIGLSFYMCSAIPIYTIICNANIIAFPMLLALIGMFFYFKSETEPHYLYYSIILFSLCALTELFSAVWIFGILLILIFQRNFRRFVLLGIEVIAIFCLVCLPFLINDAIGFVRRLFWQMYLYEVNFDGTIWVFQIQLLSYIPVLLAIGLCTFYLYQNYKKTITMDFFIVVISIFLFFSPAFGPYHYLWFFPVVSINIVYSFRKYIIANLFFLGWFATFLLIWAIGEIIVVTGTPGIYGDLQIHIMLFQMLGQTLAQLGCLYLVYSCTSSKKILFAMLIPFFIVYTLNLIWWIIFWP